MNQNWGRIWSKHFLVRFYNDYTRTGSFKNVGLTQRKKEGPRILDQYHLKVSLGTFEHLKFSFLKIDFPKKSLFIRLSSFDGSKFVIIFVTYLIRTQTPSFQINQSFLIITPLHADHINRDQIIATAII